MDAAEEHNRHRLGIAEDCSTNYERFELLILSEAGKPIYTFTKREDAVTLMPLCTALIDYARKTQKETLQTIKTSDNLVINFATRSPLIIIVIHETHSYVDPQILVEQVEAQVISILTEKTLRSVFEERPTFDLKRLLYGSEKLIDATINLSAFPAQLQWPWVQAFLVVSSPTLSLNTQTSNNILPAPSPVLPLRPHRVLIPIVAMPTGTRDNIHGIINNVVTSNSKSIVFSLLFRIGSDESGEDQDTNNEGVSNTDSMDEEANKPSLYDTNNFRLISICNHHDRHKLKPADIHIMLALLIGSRAQLDSVESLWMPVCLPKFNRDAFLHSYISYINGKRNCLVMLSIDRDEFANCQKSKDMIEEKLEALYNDSNQRSKIYYQMSPLVHPILLELQEKLVGGQLVGDELLEVQQKAQIYNSKVELYHARQLQFLWYQTNKQALWWQRSARKSQNEILRYITKKMLQSSLKHLWIKLANDMICLGWHMPTFQLYAQFDGTITTNEATEVIQRITNWIKKEEDTFSIKEYR